MAVQGPPFRAVPVPVCLYQSRGGRPCPARGSGHKLSRRLAHHCTVLKTVVRS